MKRGGGVRGQPREGGGARTSPPLRRGGEWPWSGSAVHVEARSEASGKRKVVARRVGLDIQCGWSHVRNDERRFISARKDGRTDSREVVADTPQVNAV